MNLLKMYTIYNFDNFAYVCVLYPYVCACRWWNMLYMTLVRAQWVPWSHREHSMWLQDFLPPACLAGSFKILPGELWNGKWKLGGPGSTWEVIRRDLVGQRFCSWPIFVLSHHTLFFNRLKLFIFFGGRGRKDKPSVSCSVFK